MELKRMTGGQAVVAVLSAHGVDTVFGIPGGHNLAIYDALAQQQTIRHVLGRHEQGLGFMADGYARACGRVGVALVTSGPAVANLGAALGGATTDTSAVLAIASTVQSDLLGKNRGGLHDCGESLEIMRPLCRHVCRCVSAREIPATIAGLLERLRTGRPGAAYCEIPCDVLNGEAQIAIPSPASGERLSPQPEQIRNAAQMLAGAGRPVLWVGTGAVASDAATEVDQLARRLGAIVVPTTLARGILPSDDPRVVSDDGVLKTPVTELMAQADVMLAVGSMFKQEDTAAWKAKMGQRLIHIDIDPNELGRSYAAEVGIVADAKLALQALLAALPDTGSAEGTWCERGKQAEEAWIEARRRQSPFETDALGILRSVVPRDAILACDRCNLSYWAYRMMPVFKPRTFFYPMGYGTLGGALPQALGAKLALPDKHVICVIGDGGFQFTATELAVAVQEKIPITVLLCNNNAYGAIRANQDKHFGGRRFGSTLVNPDFQLFARSYGIAYRKAESLEAFGQELSAALATDELNMLELTLDIADPP